MRKIRFIIPGNIPGKARPRVTKNGTFMPKSYTDFKIKSKIFLPILNSPLTPPIAIKVNLLGSHRSDADNIVGTILDLIVEHGIIANDSSKKVPDVHIIRYESKHKFADIEIKEINERNQVNYLTEIKLQGLHIYNIIKSYLKLK